MERIKKNNTRNRAALERMEQDNPINAEYTVTLSRQDLDILFDINNTAEKDKIYRSYELFNIYNKIHRQIMDNLLDRPSKVV